MGTFDPVGQGSEWGLYNVSHPTPDFETTFAFPAQGLDLAMTAAPVAWGKGRWPSVDWIGGELIQVRRMQDGDGLELVQVRQESDGQLLVTGFQDQHDAADWLRATLGWERRLPRFGDPVVEALGRRFPGLRPYAHGCSLAQALMTVIIGQGVTVQGGAVLERRVAALHSDGIAHAGRVFLPFPTAQQLAGTPVERLRATGLTGKRAEGIVQIARIALEGGIPSADDARNDPERTLVEVRNLPMIGPWSAAAALLWGIGSDDAHVTGDVALLRAVRQAYGDDDLTLKGLDVLADAWRPARAWAARLLWLNLLGPAQTDATEQALSIRSDK